MAINERDYKIGFPLPNNIIEIDSFRKLAIVNSAKETRCPVASVAQSVTNCPDC